MWTADRLTVSPLLRGSNPYPSDSFAYRKTIYDYTSFRTVFQAGACTFAGIPPFLLPEYCDPVRFPFEFNEKREYIDRGVNN